MIRLGIDTGGTFTDLLRLDEHGIKVHKIRSTPDDPSRAIFAGIAALITPNEPAEIIHGSTVATNALLERKGARVALVTTKGFEDVLKIGRQTRAQLYNFMVEAHRPLISEGLTFGVSERLNADGSILEPLLESEIAQLINTLRTHTIDSVAVCLLHSYANPIHEDRLASALQDAGFLVSTSHKILPEYREFERWSTTVVNAYVTPLMAQYLTKLEDGLNKRSLSIMQSNGGSISASRAKRAAVQTILSGPAAGVVGAQAIGTASGYSKLITFDMGGTSTDVSLINEHIGTTTESTVGDFPVRLPVLDIHTVGAGGGSVAYIDSGGSLRVGPRSAGADPGPACYGKGTELTVTDANLLLGRLDSQSFLGGSVRLESERAQQLLHEKRGPLASAEEFAAGILRVVETNMEKAIRVISVERGHDPRDFALVAFGGGGPLHACSIARALRIDTVLIPAIPGALSAVGILLADVVRDYSRTVMLSGDAIHDADPIYAELEQQGNDEFRAEGLPGTPHRSIDLRYRGQGYELNVPIDADAVQSPQSAIEAFHQLHQSRYGFSDPQKPVEIVNLRLRMVAPGEAYQPHETELIRGDGSQACYAERAIFFDGRAHPSKLYNREALAPGDVIHGPALITEYTSATALPPRCYAQVDGFDNLVITIVEESAA